VHRWWISLWVIRLTEDTESYPHKARYLFEVILW
jgi:hypothetical protein